MAIAYLKTKLYPSSIGTSRTITIPTSPATLVVMLSGYVGMQWTNVGAGAIAYGDTSISAGTGALLYYSMQKEWPVVIDTGAIYAIADSVASALFVNYYR